MMSRHCHGGVHDLISMTLMNGRFLLLCVDGFRGLLRERQKGQNAVSVRFACMELFLCVCVCARV